MSNLFISALLLLRSRTSKFFLGISDYPAGSEINADIDIYIHHPNRVGLRLLTTLANVDGSIHGNFQLLQINGPQLAY